METFLPLLIILFLVIFPLFARRKRAAAVRQFLNRKKQNKESNEMKELAKRLIGEDCIIYTTRMSSPRQKIYNFFCSFSGSFIAAHSCFKWVFTVILPFRIP